jgi:hypothetical protein
MRLLDPNTKVLGRQPSIMKWTPSKGLPWYYGDIRGFTEENGAQIGGERFTVEQQLSMAVHGIAPDTRQTMTVYRQATDQEWWWGSGSLPPRFAFECPIVTLRPDLRLTIIAPDGRTMPVYQDGWAKRPNCKPDWRGI